jgi:phospholipid transport system substrate-binding protein
MMIKGQIAAASLLIALYSGFFSLISPLSYAQDKPAPEQIVKVLHEKLLYIMQNGEPLGHQGRYDALITLIPQSFNIPLISQVLLGKHWREIDEDAKSRFISLYENLIIATYASRFKDYDGENFRFTGIEELNRGRILVKTELQPASGDTVTLDYLMDNRDDRWWIISVIANGVNDISLKRAEYADVIKIRGYDTLLEEIENKINELADST